MAVALQGSLVLEAAVRFITVGLYLATALVVFRWRITSARIAGTLAYTSKAAHTAAMRSSSASPRTTCPSNRRAVPIRRARSLSASA